MKRRCARRIVVGAHVSLARALSKRNSCQDNFCQSLRGAAAESNATNAVQDGGSTADPGPSKELPWLAPSARRPGCSATPALELAAGLLTVGALAAADALEHMSLRARDYMPPRELAHETPWLEACRFGRQVKAKPMPRTPSTLTYAESLS